MKSKMSIFWCWLSPLVIEKRYTAVEAKMTQAQPAKFAGVRPDHISGMENGRRTISKEMARKLGHGGRH
jgi:plasmid maintenance system antidote protein VapI